MFSLYSRINLPGINIWRFVCTVELFYTFLEELLANCIVFESFSATWILGMNEWTNNYRSNDNYDDNDNKVIDMLKPFHWLNFFKYYTLRTVSWTRHKTASRIHVLDLLSTSTALYSNSTFWCKIHYILCPELIFSTFCMLQWKK